MVRGRTGPVNAVEADGALFIENDGAEAEAIPSKAMEPASEVAAASKTVATTAAASEVAAPAAAPEPAVALDLEPSCAAASPAVIKSNSYAAAVSKRPVGPKFSAAASQPATGPKLSAAASQLSVDLKRSTSAYKTAAAVLTPLEVNM